MLSHSRIRLIPYLRVKEGCHIVKESIPVERMLPINESYSRKREVTRKELENYFSTKELNRFVNLLQKLSLFKRKLDDHGINPQFFETNNRLLICLRRLSLLKFEDLPQTTSSNLNSLFAKMVKDSLTRGLGNEVSERQVPELPELKSDLKLVFMHPVVSNSPAFASTPKLEMCKLTKENQRLEFYGDSVLGELVARSILERFPDATDGLLTGIKSLLVQNETLVLYAHVVGIPLKIRLFAGDISYNKKVLADCFESYIGMSKVEGGQSLEQMIVCLETLIEPIMLRIEANLGCRLGCSELKVDEVLSDWFDLDDSMRQTLKLLRRKHMDESDVLRLESVPDKSEVEQMKAFAMASPKLTTPPPFKYIKSLHREPESKFLVAMKTFDTLSELMKNKKGSESRKQVLKANAILNTVHSSLRADSMYPRIRISKKKKQIITRIWISDSVTSVGRGPSIEKSKNKLIKKLWTRFKPDMIYYSKNFGR